MADESQLTPQEIRQVRRALHLLGEILWWGFLFARGLVVVATAMLILPVVFVLLMVGIFG